MILYIVLNKQLAAPVTEDYEASGCVHISGGVDWVPALKAAAMEVQGLNQYMADLLVNGPIKCNPDSELVEGFLGDANTVPNEVGYVTVYIGAYRKLILPNVTPTTFQFVLGDPVDEYEGQEVLAGVFI